MSSPQTAPDGGTGTLPVGDFKTMLTWRGEGTDRLEQVRLHVNGARVKAYGRIIAAATDQHEAFSASYELITNDVGVTKRLSVHLVRASGETQFALTRDEEHHWLVHSPGGNSLRSDFDGAEDVDLALSPMFNALPVRRLGLVGSGRTVEVPVVYMYLPDGNITRETLTYTDTPTGIDVMSPVAQSYIAIDENGFVLNYSGLAQRV